MYDLPLPGEPFDGLSCGLYMPLRLATKLPRYNCMCVSQCMYVYKCIDLILLLVFARDCEWGVGKHTEKHTYRTYKQHTHISHHTQTHAYIHIYTHTYTHTCTHTHTHTRAQHKPTKKNKKKKHHLCGREIIFIRFRNEDILTKQKQKHSKDRTDTLKWRVHPYIRHLKVCVCTHRARTLLAWRNHFTLVHR